MRGWTIYLPGSEFLLAMNKALAGVLLLCVLPISSSLASPSGWKALLEPPELATLLEQNPSPRVIQVTGNYSRAHIAGSADSPYNNWRGPIENPGALPDIHVLTGLVQALGLELDTPVVIVHAGTTPADMGAATRVYWTLKSLGLKDLAVLNGGLRAWQDAGLPVTTQDAQLTVSGFQPQWNSQWQVATAEVESLVKSRDGLLIDSRPQDFFLGLRTSFGRPGTIRGAVNLDYEMMFEGNRLKSVDQLDRLFSIFDFSEPAVVVSFCNTGHWSSISWFVMHELLKVGNTRLYAESVAEWSQRYRPMDNQPGRLSIYGRLTAEWLRTLTGVDP